MYSLDNWSILDKNRRNIIDVPPGSNTPTRLKVFGVLLLTCTLPMQVFFSFKEFNALSWID